MLDLATEEALAELSAADETGDFAHLTERYKVEVPETMRPSLKDALDRFIAGLKRLFGVIDPSTESFTDADWRKLVGDARRYVLASDGIFFTRQRF